MKTTKVSLPKNGPAEAKPAKPEPKAKAEPEKPPAKKGASALFNRITEGKRAGPRRLFLYGVPGVGKSTFASMAPKPIFLPTDDGLDDIGPARFADDSHPRLESFGEVRHAIEALYTEDHPYKTVVIDTATALEELIFSYVCEEKKVQNIEDVGYAKGYVRALDHWRYVFDGLDALRRKRGMYVILVAHSQVEQFNSPDLEPYTRYVPALNKKAMPMILGWCDEVLFATYEVFTRKVDEKFGKDVVKGVGSGKRVLRTAERPYQVAKNRLGLPEEMPLDWREFAKFLRKKGD